MLADLSASGIAVCLPDLRGTGETRAGTDRVPHERRHQPVVHRTDARRHHGRRRLRDLCSVLAYVRGRNDIDGKRVALWGDSFAATNPPDTDFRVPYDVDSRPKQSEPERRCWPCSALRRRGACVYASGGLAECRSVLQSPFVYMPHETRWCPVPAIGDLPDLAAALAPRPLRLEGLIDGFNRLLPDAAAKEVYKSAFAVYKAADHATRFSVTAPGDSATRWITTNLTR